MLVAKTQSNWENLFCSLFINGKSMISEDLYLPDWSFDSDGLTPS